MKTGKTLLAILAVALLTTVGCKKDEVKEEPTTSTNPISSEVIPIDINTEGLGLLENMQGQWIGRNQVLAWDFTWFAFDYRPISSSHTFGIYEGGSSGNLLTSFFVSDFKNTRTIMARNGGVLAGIYRSSYFVLDQVRSDSDGDYYRLVDAQGGSAVMFMELRFKNDSLYFNAYTSRLGENDLPTRHMTFKAKRNNLSLAQTAANKFGYPQNVIEKDFSNGFNESYFYVAPGASAAKSASFLAQATSNLSVYDLAITSGDPLTINDHVNMDTLLVNMVKHSAINNATILLYLSRQPITNSNGYFQWANFDDVLQFPEIGASENSFRFTYLHQGTYYVTAVADVNGDGVPSSGDYSHASQQVTVNANGQHQITLNDITTLN